MRIRSRAVVVAAIAALMSLAAACGGSDDASGGGSEKLEPVQIMMFPGQAYRLPILVAQQEGFFADHGIEVTAVNQPGNLQPAQALIATKSQVGHQSAGNVAQGVENGTPIAYFCGGIRYLQTSLVAKNGSAIDAGNGTDVLKALSGKKVGVSGPIGSALQLQMASAVEAAGATDVTYVNIGGDQNVTLAALNKGSIDVAQVNPPATQLIQVNKSAKVLTYLPDAGGPDAWQLYGTGWSADSNWLKDNKEAAKGFCDAVAESLTWIQDASNADTATKIFSEDTKLDEAVAAEVVKTVYSDFDTQLPEDVLMDHFKFIHEIGVTKADMSLQYDKLVQPVE